MAGTGGKREGAGRPTGAVEKAKQSIAVRVFKKVNEVAVWAKLLASDDEKIVLDTMRYLTDRRDGKAAQPLSGDKDNPIAVQIITNLDLPPIK